MNPYGILATGFVLGLCAGLIIAAFCGAARQGEEEQEAIGAYYRGVKDGQASREIGLADSEEKL